MQKIIVEYDIILGQRIKTAPLESKPIATIRADKAYRKTQKQKMKNATRNCIKRK